MATYSAPNRQDGVITQPSPNPHTGLHIGDEVGYQGSDGGWRVVATQVMGTDRGMAIQQLQPSDSTEPGRIVKVMGIPALQESLRLKTAA